MLVTLVLTEEQLEFLRQALNAEQLGVAVKNSRVASEVYTLVMSAKPIP